MHSIHIFSPHIDDAFLSLGGSIMNWRSNGISVKIYNIFTISNWTTPGSLSERNYGENVELITTLRKQEEMKVAKEVNFNYEFWDFLDFPLREGFTESDYKSFEDKIYEKLLGYINPEDHFFFPLGIMHPDHLLLCRISERLTGKNFNIFYFEDMPYFSWGKFDYQELFATESLNKSPILEKINFGQKKEILKNYSSQVVDDWFRSMMGYSYNKIDNEYYERYWRVVR